MSWLADHGQEQRDHEQQRLWRQGGGFGRAGQKLVVFTPAPAEEVRGGQEEGHGEAHHEGRVDEGELEKEKT